MADLASQITDCLASFQVHVIANPWVCLAVLERERDDGCFRFGELCDPRYPGDYYHPGVMTPRDPRRHVVLEDVRVLTTEANSLLWRVLRGQHRMRDDVARQIWEWEGTGTGRGWLCWLWGAVKWSLERLWFEPPAEWLQRDPNAVGETVYRCPCYPQVAVTALRELRDCSRVQPQITAPPPAVEAPPPTGEEAAPAPAALLAGKALAPGGPTRPRLSKEEREVRVRDYLTAHKARAAKGELSIRELAQETGAPTTSIQQTAAWRGLQDTLEREGLSRRPRKRKAQAFTGKMDAAVADPELQKLMREQAADDDGSPLDKGRRGKVRVRKQF